MRIARDVTNKDGSVVRIEVTVVSDGGTEISIAPTNVAKLHVDLTPEEAATLYDLMTLARKGNDN